MSEIYVCARCYDPDIMGRWEEYTGAAISFRPCIMCGEAMAEHWFANPRWIIRGLVLRLQKGASIV